MLMYKWYRFYKYTCLFLYYFWQILTLNSWHYECSEADTQFLIKSPASRKLGLSRGSTYWDSFTRTVSGYVEKRKAKKVSLYIKFYLYVLMLFYLVVWEFANN